MLCPYCNEEIKDGAKKCKHCGEFLDKELREKRKEEKQVVQIGPNYEGCSIIKRGLFEGEPKIKCPKCGYEGKTGKAKGGYNGCLMLVLLLCGLIPGLLYWLLSKPGKYICPQCGEDHLKKVGPEKKTNWGKLLLFSFVVAIALAIFISILGNNNINTNKKVNRTPSFTERNQGLTLTELYNRNPGVIREDAVRGIKKLTNTPSHDIKGPTVTEEVGDNFLIEGTDFGHRFACVFERRNESVDGLSLVNCAFITE